VKSTAAFGAALALILFLASPVLAREAGVTIEVVLESGEVDAGTTFKAGAVVRNTSDRDQFVIVEGFLSPPAEPIEVPPIGTWERFVYQLLAKISGDCEVLFVPAGEQKATGLSIEVHPRVHGRFEVVATAQTATGIAVDRESVISKIVAPPMSGAVLVHGVVGEVGDCRVLITDDGHIYEPKGDKADDMFRLLDLLTPAPDGVTVLGSIMENTIGCYGVELGVELFRYDREPGTPVGVAFRHLARGGFQGVYDGPDEEVTRDPTRLREIVGALGAEITGRKPNLRREMVAAVTVSGTVRTTVRIGRILEADGTLEIHYMVTNAECDVSEVASLDLEAPELAPFTKYHLVALPQHGGPIRFVRHDLRVRCDAALTGVLDVAEPLALISSDHASPKTIRQAARTREKEMKAMRRASSRR
jgi:hypothetical protein